MNQLLRLQYFRITLQTTSEEKLYCQHLIDALLYKMRDEGTMYLNQSFRKAGALPPVPFQKQGNGAEVPFT